jgi:hypothetical protein
MQRVRPPRRQRSMGSSRPVKGEGDLDAGRAARAAGACTVPHGYQNWKMKLYVCWGTFPVPWPRKSGLWRPGAHPCKLAFDALQEAGHVPEVVKVFGFGQLPDLTRGRKEVKRLTGESFVPVLVLADGEVIKDSKNIVAWARENPRE